MRKALIAISILLSAAWAAPAASQSIFKDAGKMMKSLGGGGSGATDAEIAGGLKDALRVGTETVTGDLGAKDGFFGDAVAHIPLPGWMKTAQKVMRFTGQSGLLDEIELRMNRAAEGSMDSAKRLFGDAIQQMTFEDAREIVTGPDDSATRYFQSKMSSPLADEMRPIVRQDLEATDAFSYYDKAAAGSAGASFAPNGKDLLIDHAVDGALKGLFHYIAEEEKAIRNNPAKQVTPLLKKVFG